MFDFIPTTIDSGTGTLKDFKGNQVKFDLLAIIKWLIHIHMLRRLYWNFMIKGLV